MPKTFLITGATDGLGLGVARALAARGINLILHGRSKDKLAKVQGDLASEFPDVKLHTALADFLSLRQVDALADAVLREHTALHGLINNAGIGIGADGNQREVSEDGIEARFQVNYLAGYHLTHRLLDLLKASSPARIVNVSSLSMQPLDFEDLQLERAYSGGRAYAQSKLAQILFTIDLAQELVGSGVTVNALHPSTLMPTNMVREGFGRTVDTLEMGVEATVYLAIDPALAETSGAYFVRKERAAPHAQALDADARQRLKQAADQMIRQVVR